MRTPEEIKLGMEHCAEIGCKDCPYEEDCNLFDRFSNLAEDAYFYIQQLEQDNAQKDERIRQLEQRVPRWISVKERLPEGEDPVLILVKETEHYGLNKDKSKVYHCQYLAYWDDEEWYTTWCNGCRKISDTAKEPYEDDYEVTHWMPLPEPPEEEKHETD